jgi:hypothetical protein
MTHEECSIRRCAALSKTLPVNHEVVHRAWKDPLRKQLNMSIRHFIKWKLFTGFRI